MKKSWNPSKEQIALYIRWSVLDYVELFLGRLSLRPNNEITFDDKCDLEHPGNICFESNCYRKFVFGKSVHQRNMRF